MQPVIHDTGGLDELLGRGIAEAVTNSQKWCYRKVDSLRLLEAETGRRRISIDCTPPPDPHLAAEVSERKTTQIQDVAGQVFVPLALVRKGVMRDLDVSDAEGKPLPVANTEENGLAAWAALVVRVADDLGVRPQEVPTPVVEGLRKVVFAPSPVQSDQAQSGQDQSGQDQSGQDQSDQDRSNLVQPDPVQQVLDWRQRDSGEPLGDRLQDVTLDLLKDLANNFLLLVRLEPTKVGVRQVIKYSFHWRPLPGRGSRFRSWKAALGFGHESLELELSGPSWAASYHLEVHVPQGLVCTGLKLPESGETVVAQDCERQAVAHAYASYVGFPPSGDAVLSMAVPRAGLRLITWLVFAFTAAVFDLERLLPGATQALAHGADGAVAILLAAPAAALALIARPGENVVAASLLGRLRALVISCAALLVAGAASIVGELRNPWYDWLWWMGASFTSAVFVLMTAALVAEWWTQYRPVGGVQ